MDEWTRAVAVVELKGHQCSRMLTYADAACHLPASTNGGANAGGGAPEGWVPALEEALQDFNPTLAIEADGRYIISTQVSLAT
jgi:hypothetical protein